MPEDLYELQRKMCKRSGTDFVALPSHLKVGISENVKENIYPLNALRHPTEGETSGWYIWAGEELFADNDFFIPLHISHLPEWCPEILPYLGLPPGWRVLLAPGYEDVWFDALLLKLE